MSTLRLATNVSLCRRSATGMPGSQGGLLPLLFSSPIGPVVRLDAALCAPTRPSTGPEQLRAGGLSRVKAPGSRIASTKAVQAGSKVEPHGSAPAPSSGATIGRLTQHTSGYKFPTQAQQSLRRRKTLLASGRAARWLSLLRVRIIVLAAVFAAILQSRPDIADAAVGVKLSNGPTQIASRKSYGAGNSVQMGQVTAIPNASTVNAYMQIGSSLNVPLATSQTALNRQVGSYCSIVAFGSWAADNWVWVRGNHNYDVLVDGVNAK